MPPGIGYGRSAMARGRPIGPGAPGQARDVARGGHSGGASPRERAVGMLGRLGGAIGQQPGGTPTKHATGRALGALRDTFSAGGSMPVSNQPMAPSGRLPRGPGGNSEGAPASPPPRFAPNPNWPGWTGNPNDPSPPNPVPLPYQDPVPVNPNWPGWTGKSRMLPNVPPPPGPLPYPGLGGPPGRGFPKRGGGGKGQGNARPPMNGIFY